MIPLLTSGGPTLRGKPRASGDDPVLGDIQNKKYE